jgi:hypothetical protein
MHVSYLQVRHLTQLLTQLASPLNLTTNDLMTARTQSILLLRAVFPATPALVFRSLLQCESYRSEGFCFISCLLTCVKRALGFADLARSRPELIPLRMGCQDRRLKIPIFVAERALSKALAVPMNADLGSDLPKLSNVLRPLPSAPMYISTSSADLAPLHTHQSKPGFNCK